jgi:hypothetical protein
MSVELKQRMAVLIDNLNRLRPVLAHRMTAKEAVELAKHLHEAPAEVVATYRELAAGFAALSRELDDLADLIETEIIPVRRAVTGPTIEQQQ